MIHNMLTAIEAEASSMELHQILVGNDAGEVMVITLEHVIYLFCRNLRTIFKHQGGYHKLNLFIVSPSYGLINIIGQYDDSQCG